MSSSWLRKRETVFFSRVLLWLWGQLKDRRYLRFGRQGLPEVTLDQIQQAILFGFISPAGHAALDQHFQVLGQAGLGDALQRMGDFSVADAQGLFHRFFLFLLESVGVDRERDLHGSGAPGLFFAGGWCFGFLRVRILWRVTLAGEGFPAVQDMRRFAKLRAGRH
nr:hypothetical protein [Pseudomonas moraviensis]